MQIKSIRLKNFRKFVDPVVIDGFDPQLNILAGPNELGKSTILAALRGVLFEKHSSKNAFTRSFQPNRHETAPEIALEFAVDDGVYTIEKRFLKSSPMACLTMPDGRIIEGSEAEDALAGILGFEPPSTGNAKDENLGTWSILWVEQGMSFDPIDINENARHIFHSCLEAEVGRITGGKRGRQLTASIEDSLLSFTNRRGQPTARWKDVKDQISEANSSLQAHIERRDKLETSLSELPRLLQKRNTLGNPERDARDEADLKAAKRAQSELLDLMRRIAEAATQVKQTELDLSNARQALAGFLRLENEHADALKRHGAALARVTEITQRQEDAERQYGEAKTKIATLKKAVDDADKNVERLHVLSEIGQISRDLDSAQSLLAKGREASQRRNQLLADIARQNIDEQTFKKVLACKRRLDEASSALRAASTQVMFDILPEAAGKVRIEKEIIENAHTMDVVTPLDVTIENIGKISIEPRIEDRDSLLSERDTAREAYQRLLEKFGLSDIEAAEECLRRRRDLETEAERIAQQIEIHLPGHPDRGIEPGIEGMESFVSALGARRQHLMDEHGISSMPADAEVEEQILAAEQAARAARTAHDTEIGALAMYRQSAGNLKQDYESAQKTADTALEEVERSRKLLEEMMTRQDKEALTAAIGDAENLHQQALARHSSLLADKGGETPEQIDTRIKRLEAAIKNRHDELNTLDGSINTHRAQIAALEGDGIDEKIAELRDGLARLEAEDCRYGKEKEILSLLRQVLSEADSEAKERFLAPVVERIKPYLGILFPNCDVRVNEDFEITEITRTDNSPEPFSQLSGGTREQIAVLCRLAFADLLAERGRSAMVVLDDALAFSDDVRIEAMFDVLNAAAQKNQIVVLTCREDLFTRLGGKRVEIRELGKERLAQFVD